MMPSGTTRGERASPTSSRSTTSQSYATQHLSNGFIYAAVFALIVGTRASVFVGVPSGVAVLLRAIGIGAALCALRGQFRRWFFVCLLIVGIAGGTSSLHHAQSPQLGAYQGAAKIMEDPQWRNGGVQTVLQLEGERFIVYAYGLPGRRLSIRRAGEVVRVSGDRLRLEANKQYRLSYRHIMGTFAVRDVSENFGNGSVLSLSANNIRKSLQDSADVLPRNEGALFMGLIVGDDRLQPASMITAFRNSGLSHLTAVSGQNVAFLLTVMSPVLMRARSSWRLGLTLFVLLWFTVVTRGEPSVLRAAMMAGFVALGTARGRDTPARRMLGLAIIVLIVCDPLLAWSVGFWMSSSATLGLLVITPQLAKIIPGPAWFSAALSTTMGAQLGVMPITAIIFHSAPLIALATNLLAVPIAGAVMLVGIPLGMLAGILAQISAGPLMTICVTALMWPVGVAVRWVWWVAVLGDRWSMHGSKNAFGWCIVALLIISARISAWRST